MTEAVAAGPSVAAILLFAVGVLLCAGVVAGLSAYGGILISNKHWREQRAYQDKREEMLREVYRSLGVVSPVQAEQLKALGWTPPPATQRTPNKPTPYEPEASGRG